MKTWISTNHIKDLSKDDKIPSLLDQYNWKIVSFDGKKWKVIDVVKNELYILVGKDIIIADIGDFDKIRQIKDNIFLRQRLSSAIHWIVWKINKKSKEINTHTYWQESNTVSDVVQVADAFPSYNVTAKFNDMRFYNANWEKKEIEIDYQDTSLDEQENLKNNIEWMHPAYKVINNKSL